MSHVFISYARSDREFANRLRAELESAGISVWIDQQLHLGEDWEYAIRKAVANAGAVIVIISSNSAKSEWIQNEVSLANMHKKLIYPIWVSGDAPDIPFLLADYQILDARQGQYPHTVKRLVEALQNTVAEKG